jgi:putative membrane protein
MRALTDQDRKRIEAAVRAAEARTSAELALVVARASDDYALFPLLWAAVLALAAGGLIAVARPETTAAPFFAVEAAIFVVAGLVLHLKPLRFRLVPGGVGRTHASRLARLQFAALVDDRTRGEMGVLLFLSLAERHVEILADRGIAARIPESAWQGVIARFVAEVRAGEVAAALTGAIEGCTAILETHFPPVPGQKNEIADRITEI